MADPGAVIVVEVTHPDWPGERGVRMEVVEGVFVRPNPVGGEPGAWIPLSWWSDYVQEQIRVARLRWTEGAW